MPDANGSYGEWEEFAGTCIPLKLNGQKQEKIEMEKKHSGYGYYDRDNKNIIMMGGYVDCANEEKISKRIILISQDSLPAYSLGKTCKTIFESKTKCPTLFPFVYGLPFTKKEGIHVLNTNGYFDHLNNNRKLFLTQMNKSNVPIYNAIKWQSKLNIQTKEKELKIGKTIMDYEYDFTNMKNMKEEDVMGRERELNYRDRIVDYIVLAGDKINRYEGRCSLRTLDEGPWVLEIKERTLLARSYATEKTETFELKFD